MVKGRDSSFQELVKRSIRNIPDFPREGILFRDITTLLQNGPLFNRVIDMLYEYCRAREAEGILAIESRGFIFGGALSDRLKIPFIPIRKIGKLPHVTEKEYYTLEYGEACVEIHRDALKEGQKIVIIDDLLATGGTAAAAAKLVEKCGGKVAGIAFLAELKSLKGREKLKQYDVYSLVQYDD